MKNTDLIEILESFPGKEKFKEGAPEYIEFCYIDFLRLAKEIKNADLSVDLESEDLWYQMIAFIDIANEFIMDLNSCKTDKYLLGENDFLSEKSKVLSMQIAANVNTVCHGDALTASGILLPELVEFAKSGKKLL